MTARAVWWKGIQAEGRASATALRWERTWCLRAGAARAGGEGRAGGAGSEGPQGGPRPQSPFLVRTWAFSERSGSHGEF